MNRIKHRVGIVGSPEVVWDALIEPEKLSGWWSSSADGNCEIEGILNLHFAGLTTLIFEITGRDEHRFLHFRNIGGPDSWRGSDLEFQLRPSDGQTFLTLLHSSDRASEEEFQFFVTKWPLFLVSLKAYVEIGKGLPFPNDIKIEAEL
jgi:hypothetical protein